MNIDHGADETRTERALAFNDVGPIDVATEEGVLAELAAQLGITATGVDRAVALRLRMMADADYAAKARMTLAIMKSEPSQGMRDDMARLLAAMGAEDAPTAIAALRKRGEELRSALETVKRLDDQNKSLRESMAKYSRDLDERTRDLAAMDRALQRWKAAKKATKKKAKR